MEDLANLQLNDRSLNIAIQYGNARAFTTTNHISIYQLTFEHHRTEQYSIIGIGESAPRISWRFDGEVKDWIQKGYEISIFRDAAVKPELYFVDSEESVLVPWPGKPLKSREWANVKVRVWGAPSTDEPIESELVTSGWSDVVTVEAGLLNDEDWTCSVVEGEERKVHDAPHEPYLFRNKFELSESKKIKKARLYCTAHGLYEAFINGQRVGNHVLAPGWTEYNTCLTYQTFDVTHLLRSHGKENVIAAEVGEGWYIGRIGFNGGYRNIWGNKVGFIAQLEVEYQDGKMQTISTDKGWTWSRSATTDGEIYDGERYDARLAIKAWNGQVAVCDEDNATTLSSKEWEKVETKPLQKSIMRAPLGPPIRRVQTLAVREVMTTPSGHKVLDFGQNLVGWLRIKAKGTAGQTITIRHAEVLERGEIATAALRSARATDILTLSGKALTWEPKFTFHGFRYVQVEAEGGKDWELKAEDFVAVVVHTDMERTGWFECSDSLLNRLHENVLWSMKGNFVGIPTDCPQRDERFGYTGDLQVFASTGIFLYNACGMLKSWLVNLAADQKTEDTGIPPMYSPVYDRQNPHEAFAVWGDATAIVPWELYNAYGDTAVLAAQYESMHAWVSKGITRDAATNLWDFTLRQLGDWLDPAAPANNAEGGQTDSVLVANAFLINTTDLMSKINTVLHKPADAQYYATQAAQLRQAFQTEYITPSGRLVSDSQTAFALAIHFSLLTPTQLAHAGARLATVVRTKSQFKISTGFAGTPLIGHALSATGQDQLFYRMLTETQCPSWLYPVTMGATTIWERWDSMRPDGSVNDPGMTSFNHYALGAVANWMHKNIGGLAPLAPGWKRFLVRPVPGGGLTSSAARFESPYGRIQVKWWLSGSGSGQAGDMVMACLVTVPPNTSARVELPGQDVWEVGCGKYDFRVGYRMP